MKWDGVPGSVVAALPGNHTIHQQLVISSLCLTTGSCSVFFPLVQIVFQTKTPFLLPCCSHVQVSSGPLSEYDRWQRWDANSSQVPDVEQLGTDIGPFGGWIRIQVDLNWTGVSGACWPWWGLAQCHDRLVAVTVQAGGLWKMQHYLVHGGLRMLCKSFICNLGQGKVLPLVIQILPQVFKGGKKGYS